jgi:sulfur carrier protein ThiS
VRIHVTLKGTHADRLAGGASEVELVDGATVQAVADLLDLPGRHCVFVLNGATVKADVTLREGDRLQAFPPMAGG